jgi:2-keto-3-deoxy-L-rhamnonate aldolase RhmA
LSFSLGLRGRQDEPQLEQAVARIAKAAKRHGKFLGRPGRNPAEIKKFQEQGFLFFMTGTELDLMAAGARALLGPLGRAPWQPPSLGI